MFVRRLSLEVTDGAGCAIPVPLKWLDSFAMRSFTNDARFDDTLPITDGVLEVGLRVAPDELARALEAWGARKGWLRSGSRITVLELPQAG